MKADHAQVARLLKTARGQIDGILKMVEEDRYCLDVSNQLMATQSILKKANRLVLKAHMNCCVREAVDSGDPAPKLEELAAAHPTVKVGKVNTDENLQLAMARKIDAIPALLLFPRVFGLLASRSASPSRISARWRYVSP